MKLPEANAEDWEDENSVCFLALFCLAVSLVISACVRVCRPVSLSLGLSVVAQTSIWAEKTLHDISTKILLTLSNQVSGAKDDEEVEMDSVTLYFKLHM